MLDLLAILPVVPWLSGLVSPDTVGGFINVLLVLAPGRLGSWLGRLPLFLHIGRRLAGLRR